MMRFVETDTEEPQPDRDRLPPAPLPEHRRVSVSLLLTALVLTATVATVYFVFPKRQNELLSAAVDAHHENGEYDLELPSPEFVAAWSVPVVGKGVPWPTLKRGMEIEGVRSVTILRRPAAVVRYRIHGEPVTLVVQRARDVPPRRHRRLDGDTLCMSWRRKKWTFTAVGPVASAEKWARALRRPK